MLTPAVAKPGPMGKRRRQPDRPRARARPARGLARRDRPASRRCSASTCAAAPSSSTRAARPRRSRGHRRGHRPRDRDHPRARRLARRLRARDLARRRGPDRGRPAERLRTPSGRSTRSGPRRSSTSTTSSRTSSRRTRTSRTRPSGPYNRLIDAVEAAVEAAAESPSAVQEAGCTASGATYYLFDANTLEPIGRPVGAKKDLFANSPTSKQPAGHRGDRGTRRARSWSSTKPDDDPTTTDVDEADAGPPQFFVLHDQPGADRQRDHRPEAELRPGHQPAERRPSTSPTRGARRSRTSPGGSPSAAPRLLRRRPARRAAAIASNRPSSSRARSRSSSTASSSRGRSSTSSTTRTGSTAAPAPRSPALHAQEAQDLAEVLKIGALPIKLALISQSTVSATLGQQALDQGLKAGLVGLGARAPLPALLLPLPRADRRRSGCSSTRSSTSR